MTSLTWDDILNNKKLIGGDIESQEDGVTYRGPISKIAEQNGSIIFTSPWTGRLNPTTHEWEKWDITEMSINRKMATPQMLDGSRIIFQMPLLGICTLYPADTSRLDPGKVKGLPKNSGRLLALFPDLPFDRAIAAKVLEEQSWSRQCEALEAMPADATLHDLLTKFRHDSSAEEFLWHYIEAATDTKEVHKLVY